MAYLDEIEKKQNSKILWPLQPIFQRPYLLTQFFLHGNLKMIELWYA